MSTPCGFDVKLGVIIHRYDPGQRRCRCGQVTNPDPMAGDYKWGYHPAKKRKKEIAVRSPVKKKG